MKKTRLNIEEIKSHICLCHDRKWESNGKTNCYAFALGLDYPEENFSFDAYHLGAFHAMQKHGYVPNDIGFYPYEDRLENDLKTLKIEFTEIDPEADNYYVINRENGTIDYYWSIALFDGCMDFHFLRKGFDGKWYHKQGYHLNPIDHDNSDRKILDPRKCNLGDYEYVKTYQLKLTKKTSILLSMNREK